EVRRAEGTVDSQQRRPLLRNVRGVCRGDVSARGLGATRCGAGPQRPRVLPAALRLARHRAQVSRHVRATETRARAGARAAAGVVRPPFANDSAGGLDRRGRAVRSRETMTTRRPRVHQILATLGYGDAIGNEVLGINRALRAAGLASDIIVETADPRLEHLTVDYRDAVGELGPDDLL